jgi:hypothetical protein
VHLAWLEALGLLNTALRTACHLNAASCRRSRWRPGSAHLPVDPVMAIKIWFFDACHKLKQLITRPVMCVVVLLDNTCCNGCIDEVIESHLHLLPPQLDITVHICDIMPLHLLMADNGQALKSYVTLCHYIYL